MRRRVDPSVGLRRVFDDFLREKLGTRPRRVALMLSAGIDSTAVGIGAHRLGHRVHAYTFQLGNRQSYDSKYAERTARLMGWTWTKVILPDDPKFLLRAWPRLYYDLSCRKKREFECTWPFLYVYPVVEERFVLNGLTADAFFILGRRGVREGGGKGGTREIFDRLRREYCEPLAMRGVAAVGPDYNPSSLMQHLTLQRENRLIDVCPYRTREAYDLLMQYSWDELNTPAQKNAIRGIYPSETKLVGARPHHNYQGPSGGISDHFNLVLDTPINYAKRSRTLDMFTADWSKREPPREVWQSIERACRGVPKNYTPEIETIES